MGAYLDKIGFIDVLDVLLVSLLLYQLYRLIKGTPALNIFLGIILVYLLSSITEALHMRMLSGILGQFTSVGVIALMIVFQQEIRRFLLLLGKNGFGGFTDSFRKLLRRGASDTAASIRWSEIEKAVVRMASTKTGALIIISDRQEERSFEETGVKLNAEVTSELIENIFFKNSPLHDGAVLIVGTKLKAARLVLPLSDNQELPSDIGMRHRAACGVTEFFDVFAVIVSEQTGGISYAYKGRIVRNVSSELLRKRFKEFKERKL